MKKTTLEFIENLRKIHNDKFDYSKVEYINKDTKVCIICPIHGEFWALPNNLLKGQGCPKCAGKYKTTEDVINEFKIVHGNKYDYSKFQYDKATTKSIIICPQHGEFWQNANKHLQGCGCPKCGKTQKLTTEEFISNVEKQFPDNFTYEKTKYVNAKTKICITCKEHGDFFILPDSIRRGKVLCPYCRGIKVIDTNSFIKYGNLIHHNKYDYSKVEYVNSLTKVCIICPQHGEFWQTPNDHINNKRGCFRCCESKLEADVRFLLEENNITFIQECNKNTLKWLNKQTLDFYLPKYQIAIECQGEQHYSPVNFFGGMEGYIDTLNRDKIKYETAQKNGVRIIYFTYYKNTPNNYFDVIYKKLDDLLQVLN